MPLNTPKFLLTFPGARKRALGEGDADDKTHQNKKRYICAKDTNRDDTPDSDFKARFSDTSDDEDAEEADDEPEQGEVLWSEDQEEYPPCAVYHPDVKKHQACITDFAVNVTDQLSKVCHEGDDIAKLHAEAIACQRFPELKKIVVALVGDAGSGIKFKQTCHNCVDILPGKSSLINSILDVPHIAREVSTKWLSLERQRLTRIPRVTTVAHAHAP